MPGPFRFGVLVHNAPGSLNQLIETARKTEDLGYDTFLLPDHLGDCFAPELALAAVAQATSVLRLGSFVFNADIRHPVLLAKEVATLDVLCGGRFEFGLGAGWMRAEYEWAGIAFEGASVRIRRLHEAVGLMQRLFTEREVTFTGTYYTVTRAAVLPRPMQHPHPPLLLGGGGRRMLTVAAQTADIVGLTCKAAASGDTLLHSDLLVSAVEQKVSWIRAAAGSRFKAIEVNILMADLLVTNDGHAGVALLAQRFGMTEEQAMVSPHLLVGTPAQICDTLSALRSRFGISYVVVWEEHLTAFAPVVALMRGA